MMSRIGNHIYSKEADTAVQFYKDAFGLETKGEPWRDDNGLIISQNLYRKTGELFMTVCDIVDQFGVSWHLAVPNDESMFDSLKL